MKESVYSPFSGSCSSLLHSPTRPGPKVFPNPRSGAAVDIHTTTPSFLQSSPGPQTLERELLEDLLFQRGDEERHLSMTGQCNLPSSEEWEAKPGPS